MAYKVTKSNKRKGKTHKVTNTKTGEVKYFGDSKLKNKPGTKAAKAAKKRHQKNIDKNPFFKAYWKATWENGGEMPSYLSVEEMQDILDFVPEYANGGTSQECPPGDVDCLARKQRESLNPLAQYSAPANPQSGNLPYVGPYGQNITENPNVQEGIITERELFRPRANTLLSGDLSDIVRPEAAVGDQLVNQGLGEEDFRLASERSQEEPNNINPDRNFQIANPYAGVDIPTAANYLGRSIQNRDALGIASSGLKTLTGLARNVVSGLGYQNRYNQVLQDYYEDQKSSRNPVQYLAYGGKKDEEIATGEYLRGIENENTEQYNAEVEAGEYYQTNQGDIAEVIGDKHTNGGEKLQMEAEDRVLSDQLKLGKDTAKMLSEKYDLKLKAKNTYSDVLDKFRSSSGLGKIIKEEAEILKKINEQGDVSDPTTRDFNLKVLTKKREELAQEKDPLEEQRKSIFDELFNIQEDSKPKEDKSNQEEPEFQFGGKLESLAKEYNISLDRAKELVTQEFAKGGRYTPKYNNGGDPVADARKTGAATKRVREGQSRTDEGLFGEVQGENYEDFVARNSSWFDFSDFDPSNSEDVKELQRTYNSITTGNKVRVDGKFGEQTSSITLIDPLSPEQQLSPLNPDIGLNRGLTEDDLRPPVTGPTSEPLSSVTYKDEDLVINPSDEARRGESLAGLYLFPDETPLPPSSLQGTIKPERRFDRVRPSEIEVEPYLQDLRDNQAAQIRNLEGLSPNARAAVLANISANTQRSESDIRNKIDTQNIASAERAIYTNAQIQRMEENASEADRLAYEQRQYRAQALTDNDLDNYYSQLQSINKQRFQDIQNLNLINARNEDVFFDGQTFRRKTSDDELFDRATRQYRRN